MLYLADVLDTRVLVNMVDSSVVNILLTTSRNVFVSCGHKKQTLTAYKELIFLSLTVSFPKTSSDVPIRIKTETVTSVESRVPSVRLSSRCNLSVTFS